LLSTSYNVIHLDRNKEPKCVFMTWRTSYARPYFEAGSVKHAAYVVLAAAGPAGMTVADVAQAATQQRCAPPHFSPC
jgi:hypothetical protein